MKMRIGSYTNFFLFLLMGNKVSVNSKHVKNVTNFRNTAICLKMFQATKDLKHDQAVLDQNTQKDTSRHHVSKQLLQIRTCNPGVLTVVTSITDLWPYKERGDYGQKLYEWDEKNPPKNPPKPPTTKHELMHRKAHKPQIHAIQLRAVPQLGRSRKNWQDVIHSLSFWKDQKVNVKTQQSRCSTAQKDKKNKISSIKFFIGRLDKYCKGTFSACQRARRRGV